MSLTVSPHGLQRQNCAAQQALPLEAPPLSASTSISEMAGKMLRDPSIPPLDGPSSIMSISSSLLYKKITALLPRSDQAHLAQTCRRLYTSDWVLRQQTFPVSFGIDYPCGEETQTLDRIETILGSLRIGKILTEDEKKEFCFSSAEEILINPGKFYELLERADRRNLVAIISENTNSFDLTKKSFDEKVVAVLEYLRNNNNEIIELNYYGVAANIPKEICSLKNLEKLYFQWNRFRSIPPEVGRLQNLQVLRLSYSRLTSLPSEIGRLQNLQDLDLRSNQLTSIPPEIGNLENLQNLDLQSNQLTSIPPEIGNLRNLKELRLAWNRLTFLPAEIGNLRSLEKLFLSDYDQLITTLTLSTRWGLPHKSQDLYPHYNQIESLPSEIGNLENLKELYIEHNRLNSFPETLANLPQLNKIILAESDTVEIPGSLRSKIVRTKEIESTAT